jgi:hypothetical protein
MYYPRAVLWHLPISEWWAAIRGDMVSVNVATPQNNHQQSINRASTEGQQRVNRGSTERQQFSLLNLLKSDGYATTWPIIKILRAVMGNTDSVNVATAQLSINSVSTERLRFLVSHLLLCIGCARVHTHNRSIHHLVAQYGWCRCHYRLELKVSGLSTIFGWVREVIWMGYTCWYV